MFETLVKICLSCKAKFVLGTRDVEHTARLTIGLALVPDDITRISDNILNFFGKILDGDLESCPNIDWVRLVILLTSESDPFCGVLNITKLASSTPVSPHFDMLSVRLFGGDEFFN